MKLAIATNDRATLAKRTGRAKEFALIDISAGKVNITYAKNQHEHHEHKEEHEHSHGDIVEALNGIDILALLNVGKHLKADLDKAGIKYEKVKFETIQETIDFYASKTE